MLVTQQRLIHTGGVIVFCIVALPLLAVLYHMVGMIVTGNFSAAIWDSRTNELLVASFLLSAFVMLCALLLAIWFIVVFSRISTPILHYMLLVGVLISFFFSPIIHYIAWQELGLLNLLPAFVQAGFLLAWNYFPLILLGLLMGSTTLSAPAIEDSTLLLSGWRFYRHAIIPHFVPILGVSMLLVFILSFIHGELPPLLGYRIYPEEILMRLTLDNDMQGALASTMPVFVIAFICSILITRFIPRVKNNSWRRNSLPVMLRFRVAQNKSVRSVYVLLALFMFPVVALFVRAAQLTGSLSEVIEIRVVLTSLLLAFISGAIALLLAFIISEWIWVLRGRLQALLMGAVFLLLLLPGTLVGYILIEISTLPAMSWMEYGDSLLIITHVLRIVPYGILMLLALRWLSQDQTRQEVLLMGVSWFNNLRYLRLPVEWPRLVLVLAVLLMLSLNELSTTVLVVAPGTETLILRMYNLLHYGARESVAVLALLQSLMATVIIVGLTGFNRVQTGHGS